MKQRLWVGVVAAVAIASLASGEERRKEESPQERPAYVGPYTADLFRATEANDDYRRVLFTGKRSQLVVIAIPPGESIGSERHQHVEQTIVIVSGSGRAVLGGERTNVGGGSVIVVTPGTTHNLVNTGTTPLRLFTSYTPPNHIDGRVHRTKADAERDVEDQRYGRKVE